MEFLKINQYVEVHATLTQGTDFGPDDLLLDKLTEGKLQHLDTKVLERIAKKHGFDECIWSGYYAQESGTVGVVFRKAIGDEQVRFRNIKSFQQSRYKSGKDFTQKQR